MPEIRTNTVWVDMTPGKHRGLKHTVVGVDKGEVITWSRTARGETEIGGFSWMGPLEQFIHFFRPAVTP